MTYLRTRSSTEVQQKTTRIGQEKVVDGVTYVRQWKRVNFGPHKGSIMTDSAGRLRWHWVRKEELNNAN